MVGTTGIEPVTPAMSMQCSPAELRARVGTVYIDYPGNCKPLNWTLLRDRFWYYHCAGGRGTVTKNVRWRYFLIQG